MSDIVKQLRYIYRETKKRKISLYALKIDEKSFQEFKQICLQYNRYVLVPSLFNYYFCGIKIISEKDNE